MEAGHSANNGGIVAESAIAVDFAEVGEQPLDVIESLRTLGMAGEFGLLPGGLRCIDLFAQSVETLLELRQLLVRAVITGRGSLNLGDLALDVFQFLLRFVVGFHELRLIVFPAVAIS